ncbi:hypothetical protein [Vagococcus sp. CY52-2]|uniref:hypothetical protein n=1 Tax=Vagococcus sp. CY52-2 TaxID=2925838 RepID=UPI001F56E021|nr:hypothetical protein [Vagococcus sp. CY52-2]UNM90589.1 hypothetical protein MN187_10490 [Vagococcus sp. CY52-2]UNM90643.1 hypothetical protein MN187_10190 [Vagococcus sp. CY52-2]
MKFYLSRINGYALVTFFIGMLANYLFGEKVLIVAVPVFLMWLFTYDIRSHERSEKRVDSGRN